MIRIVLKKIDRSIKVENKDIAPPIRVKQIRNIINVIRPKQNTIVLKRTQIGEQGIQGEQGEQGPQGPPGAGAVLRVYINPQEAPDGTRTIFTVPESFIPASLQAFLNGLQEQFITELSATQFEFSTPPASLDTIKLVYNI